MCTLLSVNRDDVIKTNKTQLNAYGNVGVDQCCFLADESTCKLVQRRGDDLEQLMIWREQRFQKPSVLFQSSHTSHTNKTSKFDAISPSACNLISSKKQ